MSDQLDSPYQLMVSIQQSARLLDSGASRLSKSIRALAEAEKNYEREYQSELIRIFDDCKNSGARLPAEDIRRALAHTKVSKEVYADFLIKRAEVDAMKAWVRATESSLSAKQSLLNALKAELTAQ